MFCVTAHIWGDYVLCYCTYLRRLCSVLLHVSEETMFCATARIWGDYVLCYCTYLRRIWSVFLHVSEEIDVLCYCTYLRRLCSLLLRVSEETMFCVTARISKHMYDQFTIQTSLIQVSKIHFLITYISYKCSILAYIINNHNLAKFRSTPPSIWQEPLEVRPNSDELSSMNIY
jgi:hypothetical protein